MEKILSIIIPTYNMEKYLRRCLDSLLVKENLEMLEIWVVNDGSKDSSSAIAHEYADKYPTVFNVIDKANGNYGSCINAALPRCTGKYVKVLDSDDYFNTSGLSKLIVRLNDVDSDVVLLDATTISPEKSESNTLGYIDGETLNLLEQCPRFFTMHFVAYKTSVFSRFDYHQTEGISYTDTEWIFYPMFYAETLQYLSIDIYQYVKGREGQTMNPDTFSRNIWQLQIIVTQMLKYVNGLGKSIPASVRKYARKIFLQEVTMIYQMELIFNDKCNYHRKELIALDKQIEQYDKDFYHRIEQITYFKVKYIKIFHRGYRKLPRFLRRLIVAASNLKF